MKSLFEKLRIARQKKGLSLEDIAAATRIRQSILKDLEEGQTDKLPATYIRAFLRSYAREVGADQLQILREYDELSKPPEPPPPAESKEHRRLGVFAVAWRLSEHHVPIIAAAVLVISLVTTLSIVNRGTEAGPAAEIPFSEVVKQRDPVASQETMDSSWAVRSQGTPDQAPRQAGTPPERIVTQPPAPQPMLVLRAMTFDSVWIRILIDGRIREEHSVPARWSGQWRASDNFVISLSNAAAVALTLNNRSLGMIGTPGTPVQNFVIRRSDLPLQ